MFIPAAGVFPPSSIGWLLFHGGVTLADGTTVNDAIWLRSVKQILQVLRPSDGVTRNFIVDQPGSAVQWAKFRGVIDPATTLPAKFTRKCVWGTSDATNLRAEVFSILDPSGKAIGNPVTPNPVRAFTHVRNRTGLAAVTMDPDTNSYHDQTMTFGDTAYRVDPTVVPVWLTVGARVQVLRDWEYDLPGGTPAGQYDLRVACQNWSGSTFLFPPPSKFQSVVSPGSSDVGCFRWVPNPSYVASDPTSAKFNVESYAFSINTATAPPLAPAALGSSWDSITTPATVAQELEGTQSVQYSTYGATYRELTDELIMALEAEASARSRFRYRYVTGVTTKFVNGTTSAGTGHLTQVEDFTWTAIGLRIVNNGVVGYDDMPNGLTHIGRYTLAFPNSAPQAALKILTPATTTTLRGFLGDATSSGNKMDICRLFVGILGLPGGDFVVALRYRPSGAGTWQDRVVTTSRDVLFPQFSFNAYHMEIDDRADGTLYIGQIPQLIV